MPVKGNQPMLRADIQSLLQRAESKNALSPVQCLGPQQVRYIGDGGGWPGLRTAQSQEVKHGRIESRRLRIMELPANGELSWPGCRQIFVVERATRSKKRGERRSETVYGVTSLGAEQADAEDLLKIVRSHWQIENSLHWVRDVTFDEDRGRTRSGHIPQVLAAMRNTAIGLLRLNGQKNIAAACRTCAAQPWKALALIGIKRTE